MIKVRAYDIQKRRQVDVKKSDLECTGFFALQRPDIGYARIVQNVELPQGTEFVRREEHPYKDMFRASTIGTPWTFAVYYKSKPQGQSLLQPRIQDTAQLSA